MDMLEMYLFSVRYDIIFFHFYVAAVVAFRALNTRVMKVLKQPNKQFDEKFEPNN